ncbi:MAG: hypothetical protein ACK4LQ_02305 [Pararhodobacter sp.]
MHDPTRVSSFDLGTFDPVARPRRQAAAQPAPPAPRRKKAATAEREPVAASPAPAIPAIDPAELAAVQGELAALRAEVAALKDAPEAEARRKARAEAWAADLAWRGREGGRGL